MSHSFLSPERSLSKKVVIIFVLALILFSAVELVSAAGKETPQRIISAEMRGNQGAAPFSPNEDFFVYLPLVFKRWPPVPYAPILNDIDGPVLDAPYILSWSSDLSLEIELFLYYEIEESTTPDFANPSIYTTPFVYTSTLVFNSYEIAKPVGTIETYYYRVRAHNSWGAGVWSNVESVSIYTRVDNFTNPATGWKARRTSSPDISLMKSYYIDDDLETYVLDRFDFAIFSPMYPAPQTPYNIHLRTKVLHIANEVSYGIAFGGNQGSFCRVERENAMSAAGCFSHYYRINAIFGGSYWKFNVSRVDYHDDRGRGVSTPLSDFYNLSGTIDDAHDWVSWTVKVYDDGFGVYVNGRYMTWIADTKYLQDLYYGIFSSTYEYNNAHFQHEYFYVTPINSVSHSEVDIEMDLLPESQVAQPR